MKMLGFFRITQGVRFGVFFLVIPVDSSGEDRPSALWPENFMAPNTPRKLLCAAGFGWLSAIGFWLGVLGKE